MSKRTDCTVFLLTHQWVFRADLSNAAAGYSLHSLTRQARAPESTLVEALGGLESQTNRIGKQVIVLDTAIWSQLISVPRLSILDVDQTELLNVLKFEIETLSGFDAENANLAAVRTEGQAGGATEADSARFWVNVIQQQMFESAYDILKSQGAKSIGFAHPAGAGKWTGDRTGLVAEVWDEQVYLLENHRLLDCVPQRGQWPERFGVQAQEEVERLGKVLDVGSTGDDEVGQWLASVASQFRQHGDGDLPVITMSSINRSRLFSGTLPKLAAAILVAGICLAHWLWLDHRNRSTLTQMGELQKPAEEKRRYDSQLAELLEQRSQLELDAQLTQFHVKQLEFLVKHQTSRLEQLLQLLRESRTQELVIREIEPNEEGLVIKGFSLDGNSVVSLANQMREPAIPLGWHIHAPTQTGEQKMSNGGPWQFSILFEDIGPGRSQVAVPEPENRSSRPL